MTSGWTDAQRAAAPALVVAAVTGGLAARASSPYDVVGIAVAALTVLVALWVDAFGGIAAGLAGAAAVIAARLLGDQWTAGDFPLALALTAALLVLGWLTGILGARLRGHTDEEIPASVAAPAYGSLGLLPEDLARARLDEEIVRARRHRRPLTVVLLHTTITDVSLSAPARRAAQRTVARLVETLVPETAVPFALAEERSVPSCPRRTRPRPGSSSGRSLTPRAGPASRSVRRTSAGRWSSARSCRPGSSR